MAIYPAAAQIEALIGTPDDGSPLVMLNLLRFRAEAEPPHSGCTGEEAYRIYSEKMVPAVEALGGRMIWSGRVLTQVIGRGGEGFHMIALVEYPSRQAFLDISMSPFVAEIGVHRAAGLEMQWLLASRTVSENGRRQDGGAS